MDVSPGEVTAIRGAGEQKAYQRLLKRGLRALVWRRQRRFRRHGRQCKDVDIYDGLERGAGDWLYTTGLGVAFAR